MLEGNLFGEWKGLGLDKKCSYYLFFLKKYGWFVGLCANFRMQKICLNLASFIWTKKQRCGQQLETLLWMLKGLASPVDQLQQYYKDNKCI